MLNQLEFISPQFSDPRRIWVQRPSNGPAHLGLLILDAELYVQRVGAPEVLETLQQTQQLPAVTAVYVSSVDAAARHAELTCQPEFAKYLAFELKPWLTDVVGPHGTWMICGLSLSGLCAAYTALTYPHEFAGALCQSPSAWWNDEWLSKHVGSTGATRGRYWISVGNAEIQEDVTHPPTGLHQRVSQRASCQRLAQHLKQSGFEVQYSEYVGGHDPACWAEELPRAMQWLINEIPETRSD